MRSRGHGLIVRTWSRIVYTRTVALSSSEENEPQRHRGHRGKRHREENLGFSSLCLFPLCPLCLCGSFSSELDSATVRVYTIRDHVRTISPWPRLRIKPAESLYPHLL